MVGNYWGIHLNLKNSWISKRKNRSEEERDQILRWAPLLATSLSRRYAFSFPEILNQMAGYQGYGDQAVSAALSWWTSFYFWFFFFYFEYSWDGKEVKSVVWSTGCRTLRKSVKIMELEEEWICSEAREEIRNWRFRLRRGQKTAKV